MTQYHNYNIPDRGEKNWHKPLNENFERIDRDIEIRDTEANLEQYSHTPGIKYLATDTGRLYIGTDSEWRPLPIVAGAGSPKIVCYSSDGKGFAETSVNTYTGNCIFEAAQSAIDEQITAESGNVDIFIQPGTYNLTQGIKIETNGIDNIRIESPGWSQVHLNTDSVSSRAVIEINPDLRSDDSHKGRIDNVRVSGLHFNDEDRDSRSITGIYVNDSTALELEGLRLRGGYKRAVWIRNIWHGDVSKVLLNGAGSSSDGVPAIQVGDYSDTKTVDAINHIQLNHLQGDPTIGFEHAYLELRGKATRIDINFPNVELSDDQVGFVFDASQTPDGNMTGQIRGPQITGGDPAIKILDNAIVQITGGNIDTNRTAIEATGEGSPTLTVGGGIRISGGSNHPAVTVNNSWLNMGDFWIQDAAHGVDISTCQFAQISNGTIRNTNHACLRAKTLTGIGANFGHLVLSGASNSENPVYFEDVNNAILGNIFAHAKSSVPAVRLGGCDNFTLGTISAGGQATEEYVNTYGPPVR